MPPNGAASVEITGDAEDAADIACVEVSRETELGVVRDADRVFVGFEAEQRGDRTEDFFLGDLHGWRHVA
jgi:ParB family chromosome partitioning protein